MSEPHQHFTTSADGTRIAWYDFGGDGPALLLAHATGFCGRIWQPVVDALADSFHCYSYDVRGHGDSSSPPSSSDRRGWLWSRYADDAAAVLQAAGLQSVLGVGHSCGGATEILLEEARPGTFERLYLFEPVIFTDLPPTGPDPDRELAVRTRKRRATFPSREDALAAFSTRGPFVALHPDALHAYVDFGFDVDESGQVHLRCEPDDEADVYVMASEHDGFRALPRVECPVTIAHGEVSDAFTAEHMKTVAERLGNGSFLQWPGLGHFGPLEQPRAFADAIRKAFLGHR